MRRSSDLAAMLLLTVTTAVAGMLEVCIPDEAGTVFETQGSTQYWFRFREAGDYQMVIQNQGDRDLRFTTLIGCQVRPVLEEFTVDAGQERILIWSVLGNDLNSNGLTIYPAGTVPFTVCVTGGSPSENSGSDNNDASEGGFVGWWTDGDYRYMISRSEGKYQIVGEFIDPYSPDGHNSPGNQEQMEDVTVEGDALLWTKYSYRHRGVLIGDGNRMYVRYWKVGDSGGRRDEVYLTRE